MRSPPAASLRAEFEQARVERVVQREQMADVVGGILELRWRERPAQPVGTGLALDQRNPQHVLHQPLVADAGGDAGQRRSGLGVEQRLRHHAACMAERDQVFAGAVHYLEHGRVDEQRPQRIDNAGGERIDEQDVIVVVAQRDLHQRQLRPIGAFADELGVQADAPRASGDAVVQFRGVGDPVGHGVGLR